MFKRNQIVKDNQGNHFRVIDTVGEVVNLESVATRELFTAPSSELTATDRVAL